MSTGIVHHFGPDPSDRFYKLDENLLWDETLEPLEKLVLVDFLHRSRSGKGVPPLKDRAKHFRVSVRTLIRTEASLEDQGFLLAQRHNGKHNVYLACYPARPAQHPERQAFLASFAAVSDPQKQCQIVTGDKTAPVPESHCCSANLSLLSENDSLLGDLEEKERGVPVYEGPVPSHDSTPPLHSNQTADEPGQSVDANPEVNRDRGTLAGSEQQTTQTPGQAVNRSREANRESRRNAGSSEGANGGGCRPVAEREPLHNCPQPAEAETPNPGELPARALHDALYAYFGGSPNREALAEAREMVLKHARHGKTVTPELLRAAVENARSWWAANRSGNPRTLATFGHALNDVVNPMQPDAEPVPKKPQPKPPSPNRWQSWRSCLAAAIVENDVEEVEGYREFVQQDALTRGWEDPADREREWQQLLSESWKRAKEIAPPAMIRDCRLARTLSLAA